MDRREFFQRGIFKLKDAAMEGVHAHVNTQAAHWVRPPYALDELDFLLACNRCGACTGACPYGVVFPLPLSRGARVAGTPALDLLHKGCRLCEDWPCVAACETGALKRPSTEDGEVAPLPEIATARVDSGKCLPYLGPECGACQNTCPVSGAMVWESGKPRIDSVRCLGCALCREACILEEKAISIHSKYRSAVR